MKRFANLSLFLVGLLCVACATQSGLTPFQQAKLQAQTYTEITESLVKTVAQLETNPEIPDQDKKVLYVVVGPLINTLKETVKAYVDAVADSQGEITPAVYALHLDIENLLKDIMPIVARISKEFN